MAFLLAMALLALATSARAVTFTVDTTADDPARAACLEAVPDDCSLRGAVLAANAASTDDVIQVPAGTYTLTVASPGYEQDASSGDLDLSGNTTLAGAGPETTIIQACPIDQRTAPCPAGEGILGGVIEVMLAFPRLTVALTDLTIRHGRNVEATEGQHGGAIRNAGNTVTLTNVILQANVAARGGGIHSIGTLTVTDSTIRDNATIATDPGLLNFHGGGIHHTGSIAPGTLTITGSAVRDNVSASSGGGVYYALAPAIVRETTIAGNSAPDGGGGGLQSADAGAGLTMDDSTVTGNEAASSGGLGLFGGATLTNATVSGNSAEHCGGLTVSDLGGGTGTLANVTITDNTATTENGGGLCVTSGLLVRNTILAGNRDLVGPFRPDCDGSVVSQGYNLLGDANGCFGFGAAGDQHPTGLDPDPIDPVLGPLADHGGPTWTHLPLPTSPVIDAGHPAAPGAGDTACAPVDQRGVERPQGPRCDIGAVELGADDGRFSLLRILPAAGGDTGSVTARFYGSGFTDGARATLRRAGEPDVEGGPVAVATNGAFIAATFDLTGRALGTWDVVVTNPDGAAVTLSGAFTVEPGQGSQLWMDAIGRPRIRTGVPSDFTILFGNRGNVDAHAVPIGFAVAKSVALDLEFPVVSPPPQPGQVRSDWSMVPITQDEDGNDLTSIPLLLPVVPAGFTGTLVFRITASASGPLMISYGIGTPYLGAELNPRVVDGFIEGARAYAAQHFGTTEFPADAVLAEYVTRELEDIAALGVDASLQSSPVSLPQILLDVAEYAAVQGEASARGATGLLGWPTSLATLLLAPLDALAGDVIIVPPNTPLPPEVSCQALFESEQGILFGPGGLPTPSPCTFPDQLPGDSGTSLDPNDKVGSRKTPGGFLSGEEPMRWAIYFENLETATLPAQVVVITDQLDAEKLDLATLSLGPLTFGDGTVTPLPGLTAFTHDVDLRPEQDLLCRWEAALDADTGVLTWRLSTIAPATGEPTTDPLAGCLPPNVAPPEGDGSVLLTVHPKPGLATGTEICNRASIVFDTNEAIETPERCNTIDNTPPASAVLPLPAVQASSSFAVTWAGTDAGAGIASYSVFVSTNGGAFVPFLVDTAETSTTFPGAPGDHYAFYSVARDAAGNVEAAPAGPDAETTAGAGGAHDLAVTAIVRPKTVTWKDGAPAPVKLVKVAIQNRGPHPETIPDRATLDALVDLEVESLGPCPALAAVLVEGKPQKALPVTLKPKRKLKVVFAVAFDCANDPVKSTRRNPGHEDYRLSASVDHTALDGSPDAHPMDDGCPRSVAPPFELDPNPDGKIKDKGCGTKKPDGTFGAPILVDVAVK